MTTEQTTDGRPQPMHKADRQQPTHQGPINFVLNIFIHNLQVVLSVAWHKRDWEQFKDVSVAEYTDEELSLFIQGI